MKRTAYLLLLALGGCAEITGPFVSSTHVYSLDGVKLISPLIRENNDPSTFLQPVYELGPDRRLLLRLESFREHEGRVNLTEGKKVILSVGVEGDAARAKARLRACSVISNWMMLATWVRAHPWEDWRRPGGDYSTCFEGTATEHTVDFDVTAWFVDYLRGRGVNYGWILMSDGEVRVSGESSPALSPRVLFDRYL